MTLPVKLLVATTLSAVALLMISAPDAGANCLPVFFGSYDGHVYTPAVCDPGSSCPGGGDSVTDNLTGSFWALGFGDPRSGLGVDNGTWPAREGSSPEETGWIVSYPDQPAALGGWWGTDPRADGCIYSDCMAVMLSDQVASPTNQGYFAFSTRRADAGGEFVFESDIVLSPIPRPQILAIHNYPGGGSELTTIVNAPTGGVDLDAACAQNVVLGYKVYFRQGPTSSSLNRSDWSLAVGGAGPNGAPIPFGSTTAIVLQQVCSGTNYSFAASVVFDGGFETAHLSRILSISFSPGWVDHDCDGSPSFTEDGITPLDCDDSDPSVYPGAPQICDHRNNDCDDPAWPSVEGTNEDGPDVDGDSWGGTCDNCPDDPNPSLSDVNADGIGDACDTHDGLILLEFADPVHMAWQEEAGFDAWNLYRSSLTTLRAAGAYTQDPGSNPIAARDCGLPLPMSDDPLVPPFGDVAVYLVTGQAGTSENDLGRDGAGQVRPNANPCP